MPTNNYTFTQMVGTTFPQPDNVVSSTPLDLNETLLVTIAVRRPATDVSLKDYAQGVMDGRYPILSHDEFKAKFGTEADDFAVVREFVESFGITVIDQHRSSSQIRLEGTVEQFNQAFKITLLNVETTEQIHISHEDDISIPDSLVGIIEAVVGLDTSWRLKPAFVVAPEYDINPAVLGALRPAQVATAYQMPNSTGAGQTIGILEFGGGWTQSNVNKTFADYGQTPPTVVDYLVGGATNLPDDPSGASIEVMLDIAVAGGVAPGAKQVIYFASNSFAAFVDCFSAAINDSTNNPSTLSLSWIATESAWNSGGYISTIDAVLQTSVAKGITIFGAAGDWGAQGGPGAGAYTVGYPGSSPYIISCGGTTLDLNVDGTIASEVVWNNGGYATGGGVSGYETLPSYQSGKGLTYTTYPGGSPTALTTYRGVPDWGGNADGRSGYNFYYGSTDTQALRVGGTSATAPLFAGCIARMNAILSPTRVGFVHTLSYNNPSAFRDITSGNNTGPLSVGYSATTGWDAVTGLGSPIGSSIMSLLQSPSSDADLFSLTISSGTLSPVFDRNTTSYTDTVINSVSSVTVTPTRNQSNATITVNGTAVTSGTPSGSISLNVGSNTITVVVTAQDGTTTKTYTITVTRAAVSSTDATLASITVSVGTFTPAFDPAVTSYVNTVTNSQLSVAISASPTQVSSTLKLNGTTWDGSASTVNLNTGSNLQTILVTAPDATTTKSYSVDLVRQTGTSSGPASTYSIVPNTTVVSEGQTITYTISTTNVADGTTLYWTNAGTTRAADFTDNNNSGSVTVTGGSATFTRTLLNDTLTEGTETVLIQLRISSVTGNVIALADTVAVIDSSTGSSGQYRIYANTKFLIRGGSVTFTITTAGISNGTYLFWNNIGTATGADFFGGQNSGQFVVTDNVGSFTIQLLDIPPAVISSPSVTGSKTIIIQVHSGSPSGTVIATSDTTLIYDHGLIIQASDYNNMFGTLNSLMSKNPLGYGAALRSTSTSVGKLITTSTWLNAISDLQRCTIHQVGTTNTVLVAIGNSIFSHNLVKAIDVGSINESAQVLYNNSGTVHPSQLTSVTSNPSPSASSWTTSTATNIGFTWRDIADVNYFFNLGSVVKPQISVSGTDAGLWQPLVDQANLVTFSKPEFYATNSYFRNYSNGGRTLGVAYGVIGSELVASAIFSTSTANVTAIVQFAATYSVDTFGGIAAPVPSVQIINGSLTIDPNPVPIIVTKANETALVNLTFKNNTDQSCTIIGMSNVNNALTFSHVSLPVTIAAHGSVVLPITYQSGVSALYQDQILVNSTVGEIILPTVVKVNLNVYANPDNNWTLPNVTVDDLLGKKFMFSVDGGGYTIDPFSKTGTNADQFTISQDTPLNVSAFFDPKTQINGTHVMNIITRVVPNDPNIDIINVNIPVSITTNIVNQHLGSWLGPQSRANSVIGMSYDIIGGRRTLTVGFGMDQGLNQLSYGAYHAIKMLGVLGNSNSSVVGYPYQNNAYSGFLNTYGVWSSPNGSGTGSWNTNATPTTFYVNVSGTYTYEFSTDNYGSLNLDGSLLASYSDYSTSVSGSVYLSAGAHTVSWDIYNSGGPGAVGIRFYNPSNNTDLWSTLSITQKWGSWYDVFRIPLTGQAATFYAGPKYQIQSTLWYNGNNITSYFGAGTSAGTIVTVNDDGLGNLGLLLNPVGSKPGDGGEFDITVGDTTYAFNYYDEVSNRYTNLESPIGSQTHVLTGFDQNGNIQTSLVNYNVAQSSGGGGSDLWWLPLLLIPFGKVICTKLHELGHLPEDIFEADQEFGQWLLENDPDMYHGYRAWADIVVKWMEGSGPDMMLWIRDPEKRKQATIDWSTSWAREIATPWAEEIAFKAGRTEKGNTTGKVLMWVGGPISKAIGIWKRKFPSKTNKPAGRLTGLGLIGIFTLLKTIVKISNIFTKGK